MHACPAVCQGPDSFPLVALQEGARPPRPLYVSVSVTGSRAAVCFSRGVLLLLLLLLWLQN